MVEEQRSKFVFFKWLIFFSMFVGYSSYYFVRKTYNYSKPALIRELKLQSAQLGVISSSFAMAYGASKFLGGVLVDCLSARALFALGLLLSGLTNIFFGLSSTAWVLVFFWSMNGLSQGLGWPPCVKLMKVWFRADEVGTVWAVLTAGTNMAAGIVPMVTTYLSMNYGWSSVFILPGLVCVSLSPFAYLTVFNSPESAGFEHKEDAKKEEDLNSTENNISRVEAIFALLRSPFLLLLCTGYFWVFFIKTGVTDWGQLYLMQTKDHAEYTASMALSMFEVGGVFGNIAAGYITDLMKKKSDECKDSSMQSANKKAASPRMPVLILNHVVLAGTLHLLRAFTSVDSSKSLLASLFFLCGFSVFGPISLYGVLAMENAPNGLNATSHAIVGLAANVGAMFAGTPLVYVSQLYGWEGVFVTMEIVSIFVVVMLICTRNMSSKVSITHEKKE